MIRSGSIADAAGAAELLAAVEPYSLFTEDYVRHVMATIPEAAQGRHWAVDEDGEVIGWATAMLAHWSSVPGEAFLQLGVASVERRRGIGGTLHAEAEAHLRSVGARRVLARSGADEPARCFAERLGYAVVGELQTSGVDPRTLPEAPPPPPGVELRPFADFADDPRPIWQLDVESVRDVPSEAVTNVDALDFEQWRIDTWEDADLEREASIVALVDGKPAAMTMMFAPSGTGRAITGMTGTLRPFRRRGLARLLKHHSLRRAAERGVVLAITDNHDRNAAMLAVNRGLGYEPLEPRLEWAKQLT